MMGRGERSAECFLVWKDLGAGNGKDFVPNVRVKGGGSRKENTLLILQRMSGGPQGRAISKVHGEQNPRFWKGWKQEGSVGNN